MTVLDPGDREYADEQEQAAGSDFGEGSAEEEEPGTGTPVDNPDDCPHLPGDRILDPDDGTQVCTACGSVVAVPTPEEQAGEGPKEITPADPSSGEGVLRHIPWGPGQRPYTPEDVEHEILDYIARLNSGARFQAAKELELREARVKFEIEHARKLIEAPGRSEKMRLAWALLETQEAWTQVQILEQVVRTTREGMHTLRQQLTGLQSVSRSVGVTGGTGPGPRGSAFQ